MGFELNIWDYATFVTGALAGVSCIVLYSDSPGSRKKFW